MVASWIPKAAGIAYAAKLTGEGSVTLCTFGDGATSQGDFHEGVNFAAVHRLPVVFVCENNSYAISVPIRLQTANADIADRAAGYGIPGVTVDGTDVPAAYAACREAVDRARSGEGPTLIDAKVWRMNSHTSEDNHLKYRTKEEIADASEHDPITRFVALLEERRWITAEAAAKVQDEYNAEASDCRRLGGAAAGPGRRRRDDQRIRLKVRSNSKKYPPARLTIDLESQSDKPQETAPTEEPVAAVPTHETTPVWARTVPVAPPVSDNGTQDALNTAAEADPLPALPMQKDSDPEWAKTETPAEPERATDPKQAVPMQKPAPKWAQTVPAPPGEPVAETRASRHDLQTDVAARRRSADRAGKHEGTVGCCAAGRCRTSAGSDSRRDGRLAPGTAD